MMGLVTVFQKGGFVSERGPAGASGAYSFLQETRNACRSSIVSDFKLRAFPQMPDYAASPGAQVKQVYEPRKRTKDVT